MTAAVIKVLALVVVLVFAAVVFIVAVLVQRKFGSKWLWVVWLAPTVMYTSFLLTQVDYTVHSMISRPVLLFATSNFVLMSILSGMTVWHAGVWFGPRPPSAASNGMSDLPLTVPAGKLGDEYGLTGILGRYQKILATYAKALDAADPNPYPSLWCVFLSTFRGFLPSSVRRGRERVRQMGQVPTVLTMRLIGAEAVLAELETLTSAQLSAIEACHRTNVQRLRQGSVFGWKWRAGLAGLISVISGLVGVLKLKDIDLWPFISGITMMGTDIPSSTLRGVIGGFLVFLVLLISNGIHYLPILQRLQAFEDILTIAKAYRKGRTETTESTPQKGSIEDLEKENMWKARSYGRAPNKRST